MVLSSINGLVCGKASNSALLFFVLLVGEGLPLRGYLQANTPLPLLACGAQNMSFELLKAPI